MGASNSKKILSGQLVALLKRQGTGIKMKTAKTFIAILEKHSPWFMHSESFNIPDWEKEISKRLIKRKSLIISLLPPFPFGV